MKPERLRIGKQRHSNGPFARHWRGTSKKATKDVIQHLEGDNFQDPLATKTSHTPELIQRAAGHNSPPNVCSNMALEPLKTAVTMRDLCPALQSKTFFN